MSHTTTLVVDFDDTIALTLNRGHGDEIIIADRFIRTARNADAHGSGSIGSGRKAVAVLDGKSRRSMRAEFD